MAKTVKQKQEMDLIKLMEKFGSEDKCFEYLEALRFPNGLFCIRCQSDKISRIYERRQFHCDACGYQFSVRTDTIFHGSHLPLQKWFVAIYLMCESRKGISANQLKRTLKVAYKTAWYLCHRIRKAVENADDTLLTGIADADTRHEKVNHSEGEYVRYDAGGDIHTNGMENVWSLFKRSIVGAYHQVSDKHLDRYLDEMEFRFNNRNNPYIFRDTILRLIASENLEYKELIHPS